VQGKTKHGKGTKIMTVAVLFKSAIAHEVTLAMATLLHLVVPDALQNLVAYNATTRIASTESWVLRH
jgi:hypothetical protein